MEQMETAPVTPTLIKRLAHRQPKCNKMPKRPGLLLFSQINSNRKLLHFNKN